ncbi:MAG: DNA polymerase III subunit gamma/tau, partial [Acidimicrobiales bacterium]
MTADETNEPATGQYQSLYRRYRPQRFAEIRGQDHVVLPLRNAVRDGRIAHAYLFSGPRGTGKTSTARILAKALNCEHLVEGDPCGTCDSCAAIARGASLDVHELDAASNNGVDDMRDLVARASLASPGEWKIYIVDEVHMLSTAASNALLKTLEDPPDRVVFVLATTAPQKVLPTIRSRTQHYEFRLFDVEVLQALLVEIADDARLVLPDDGVAAAVRRGHGSARDAISALDQVAAAGVVDDDDRFVRELVEAIAEQDTALALRTVADAFVAGHDGRRLGEDLVVALRGIFLAAVAPGVGEAPQPGLPALGPARSVRAMEVLGSAMIDMRESLDPRTTLEVALVRLTRPDVDDSPIALVERLERLEQRLGELAEQRSATSPASGEATGPPSPRPLSRQLSRQPTQMPPAPGPASPPPSPPPPAPGSAPAGSAAPVATVGPARPTRDDVVTAWADVILPKLRPRARAVYAIGRFTEVVDDEVVLALPN